MSAAAAVVLAASVASAGAQGLTYPPDADKPYTLVLEVMGPEGKPEGHSSTKCKSFLADCYAAVPIKVEGHATNVVAHGRSYDGRNFHLGVMPKGWSTAFQVTGDDQLPLKTGQQWEGKLIRKHVDIQPGWTWQQVVAAQKRPPKLLGTARIRIEE